LRSKFVDLDVDAIQSVVVGSLIGSRGDIQGVLNMPFRSKKTGHDVSLMGELKTFSGKTIEQRRRRARMTQEQLAERTGIGVRWIREIESGNPRSSFEHHISCASALGLPMSYLMMPVMFLENDMVFPVEFLAQHYAGLEEHCLKTVSDYCVEVLANQFRPRADRPLPVAAERR
jgi:transcriptional regulator with XRE-family HTH domain